jgi:hypothetical protein
MKLTFVLFEIPISVGRCRWINLCHDSTAFWLQQSYWRVSMRPSSPAGGENSERPETELIWRTCLRACVTRGCCQLCDDGVTSLSLVDLGEQQFMR